MEKELQSKPTMIWLFVLSVFAIILSLRLVLTLAADADFFPINSLKIKSSYRFVSREQIQKVLLPYLSQSFLSFSGRQLSQEIKKNRWIDEVTVKKVWPDRVDVQISERFPVAVWNGDLMTQSGVVFMPKQGINNLSIPYLYGPKNQQKDVLQIYEKLSKLLKDQDFYIMKLRLHDNQSWEMVLSNGVVIQLGKDDIEMRLRRFSKVYPKLFAATFDQVSTIDLRYSKGIAVKWRNRNDQINSNPKT